MVSLEDQFHVDEFDKFKIMSMAALIVQDPINMSKLSSDMFYNENLSLNERIAILTAISIATEEIAGCSLFKKTKNFENIYFNGANKQLTIKDNSIVSQSADKIKVLSKCAKILFYNLIDVKKSKYYYF